MSTNDKYNNPQDIDINTLVEVLDLFTDFCTNFDGWKLEERFVEFFGTGAASHRLSKLGKNPTPSDFVRFYQSMSFLGREQFLKVVVADRFEANKDYLTALPLDYRPESGSNPIFAPFESLTLAVDTIAKKEPVLAGQLVQTLTDLTAISFRREGVQ